MAKYAYPAVFTKEREGYSIRFPDFDSCYTCAKTVEEGIDLANDALCLVLYDLEEDGKVIPPVSDIKSVAVEDHEFVTLIGCDTLEYRKFYNNKAIKKTLTVPAWLNTMAEKQGINFSAVLQNALKKELNIR